MIRFEFTAPARVVFGAGAVTGLGSLAGECGRHALVVTGRTSSRAERIIEILAAHSVASTVCAISGEPTVPAVAAAVERFREVGAELVVGFGGGSALDAAKAIAGLVANPGAPTDYLEVIGRAQPLKVPAVPWIGIPTTAGTGAEVTRNAVLAAPDHQVKVSLRSPLLLARAALIDPELTWGMPPAVTAATGLDALTQLIEPWVSNRANPLTDALCREGIPRIARSLRRAWADGRDPRAREDMALASLWGGLALAHAGLGAVHGFAAPIGGMFPAPHGAVCAALLAAVIEVNVQAMRQRQPAHPALERYRLVAEWLTGQPGARIEDGTEWIRALCRDLGIPSLRAYGLGPELIPAVTAKAAQASSMKANPIVLTPDELSLILATVL